MCSFEIFKKKNEDRFIKKEREQLKYFCQPQILFQKEKYRSIFGKQLAACATLYSIYRNTANLSFKNNWRDAQGHVYIKYSNKEMCKLLQISEGTLIKLKRKLKEAELIYEIQEGQNRCNKIYVLEPEIEEMKPAPAKYKGRNFKNCSQNNNYTSNLKSTVYTCTGLSNYEKKKNQDFCPKDPEIREIFCLYKNHIRSDIYYSDRLGEYIKHRINIFGFEKVKSAIELYKHILENNRFWVQARANVINFFAGKNDINIIKFLDKHEAENHYLDKHKKYSSQAHQAHQIPKTIEETPVQEFSEHLPAEEIRERIQELRKNLRSA